MKKIRRRPLSAKAREHLKNRQGRVDAQADPEAQVNRANTLWDSKKSNPAGKACFTEIDGELGYILAANGILARLTFES